MVVAVVTDPAEGEDASPKSSHLATNLLLAVSIIAIVAAAAAFVFGMVRSRRPMINTMLM